MDKPYQHKVNDQRMHNMFVPAWVDELPVDVYAWRIYGRLVRRSGDKAYSWESVAKMAEGTRMSERRARQALSTLEKHSLIRREYRNQKTTIYHLMQPDPGLQEVQAYRHDVPPPHRQDVPPLPAPDAPEGNTREVNTIEGNTKEKNKDSFSEADAREFVDLYNEHRGGLPKAMKANADRIRKLKKLVNEHGVEEAKQLLEAATRQVATNSWYIDNNHGLGNLLANGNYLKHAEAWEANKPKAQPSSDDRRRLDREASEEYWERTSNGEKLDFGDVRREAYKREGYDL